MALVLVIDDEDLVRMTIARALQKDGHTVIEGINGADGIRKIRGRKIDLIITDILMPDQEGIETIIQIRKDDKKTPIIAISGGGRQSSGNFLDIAQTFGADIVMKKPFSTSEIRAAVHECLAGGPDPSRARLVGRSVP